MHENRDASRLTGFVVPRLVFLTRRFSRAPAAPPAAMPKGPLGTPELAQALLAAIVESSDDAIVSKTLDGTITSWNGGAERIFGYTAAEAVGRSITLIIPEERLGEEAEVLTRLRRGEKIDHFETVRRAKDGRRLDISLTVSPIRDDTGRIVGASKVARDVSERKRLEAEQQVWLEREQRARREAERALQSQDEFLASVSHELRSPLNAILGWVHLLRTGELDPDRARRALETIERNARSQSRLIGDILDAQGLASGKLRLALESVDVALVVEGALDSIRPSADSRRIALTSTVAESDTVVRGDPSRLQQVIWNLLSNAVKFTPSGGEVSVLVRATGTEVDVTVLDTGSGLRPEFLPSLFQRFRQDVQSGGRGGLGLGLAIVRQLVELHGGRVEGRNREDGPGAAFTVSLPLLSGGHVAAVTPPSGGADADDETARLPALRDVRVVVADDEPDAREVVAVVLGRCGADVALAASAEEALALLDRTRPHVLVCDIAMPGLDGYALVRAVRARQPSEGGRTPAIALTAAGGTEDRLRALRAGFQYHIAKPVHPVELAEAVASLVPGGLS